MIVFGPMHVTLKEIIGINVYNRIWNLIFYLSNVYLYHKNNLYDIKNHNERGEIIVVSKIKNSQ